MPDSFTDIPGDAFCLMENDLPTHESIVRWGRWILEQVPEDRRDYVQEILECARIGTGMFGDARELAKMEVANMLTSLGRQIKKNSKEEK